MAVKIRLTRIGKKGKPIYRVGIFDESKKRDGKYIDEVGYYNPAVNPPVIQIDVAKVKSWIQKGAQPSPTVAHLIQKKIA